MASGFEEVRTLSFDCYGTLIDWESGIVAALERISGTELGDGGRVLDAFARNESAVQQASPRMRYPEVLASVYERIAGELGLPAGTANAERFGASVGDWPAFPDAAAALATLKERFTLVVLSNVDLESLSRSAARLGDPFDVTLTAETIGSYKPDARNFSALLKTVAGLEGGVDGLVHVAQSLYHDHVPAKEVGLRTVWIDRRAGRRGGGATPDAAPVAPDWRFTSMAEFAAAV